MPIRARVALFGASVVALAMLVFSILLFGLAAAGAASQQDRDLATRADEAEAYVQAAGPDAFAPRQYPLPVDLAESTETFIALLDPSGQVLLSTGTLDGAPPAIPGSVLAEAARTGRTLATVEPGLRLAVRPFERSDGQNGFVVAGRAARGIQTQLGGLRGLLVISGIVVLAASLAASWLAAGRALRPIDAVANLTEEIGLTRDLTRRLPPARGRDEVGRLTSSFNGMLQRLQEANAHLAGALEAQRRFVADASHELRTPLTTVRANAGLLLGRDDLTVDDRTAALRDIASESERMTRLVQDLLTLARADAGQQLRADPVDLAALVQDVSRKAQSTHPSRVWSVWTEGAPTVGDRDALTQLVWILVDNAARFTRDGGRIDLHLVPRDGHAELSVADDGAGIPEADLERIFDRFYQADRQRSTAGSGLGLSIARWIATQHNGQVTARNRSDGGAVFTVNLPLR